MMTGDMGFSGHDDRVTPPSQGRIQLLSPVQEVLAERVAWHVAERMKIEIKEWTQGQIRLHSAECPFGKHMEVLEKKLELVEKKAELVEKKTDLVETTVSTTLASATGGWKVLVIAGTIAVGSATVLVALFEILKRWQCGS